MASSTLENKSTLPAKMMPKSREKVSPHAFHIGMLHGLQRQKLENINQQQGLTSLQSGTDNIPALLLQNWIMNSLGVTPFIPPISPSFQTFPNQEKMNFLLQDLNERYKELLIRNLAALQKPISPMGPGFPGFVPIPPVLPQLHPGQFGSFPPNGNLPGRLIDFRGDIAMKQRMPQTPVPALHSFPSMADQERFNTPKEFTKPIFPRDSVNFRGIPKVFSEEPTNLSQVGKQKTSHKCIYCGKLYSRKYGLKIHIRTHTGYKPLKCKVCGRPFGDPSNLNKHVRLHAEGDTPYRCDFCGKVLVRRRDLERHIKSRHPDSVKNIQVYSNAWKLSS